MTLPADARSNIVDYLASGIPLNAVRTEIEKKYGYHFASNDELLAVFQEESRKRWQGKFETASFDAETIQNLLRHSDFDFSEALLKTLGQETFRMITQRELDCKQIEKFTRLLLQARAQDNAKQRTLETLKLQRLKLEHQLRSQIDKALQAFADEIKDQPQALLHFHAMRAKIREHLQEGNRKPEESQPNSHLSALNPDSRSPLYQEGCRVVTGRVNPHTTSHNPEPDVAPDSPSSGLPSPASGFQFQPSEVCRVSGGVCQSPHNAPQPQTPHCPESQLSAFSQNHEVARRIPHASNNPEGVEAISRGSSEAIPPVSPTHKPSDPGRGRSQRPTAQVPSSMTDQTPEQRHASHPDLVAPTRVGTSELQEL